MHLYFDIETYKILDDKDNKLSKLKKPEDIEKFKKDNTISKPYLIGVCYFDETNEKVFKHFLSINAFESWLKELYFKDKKTIHLWGYNVQYDISNLIPLGFFEDLITEWVCDENNKFLWCRLKKGRKNIIKFNDLWRFKMDMRLDDWLTLLNLPNKKTINYDKWNVKFDIQKAAFNFIDSNNEKQTASLFDELDYLKNDVWYLDEVRQYIRKLATEGFNLIDWQGEIPEFKGITSGSYAKHLLNYHFMSTYNATFDQLLRPEVSKDHYLLLKSSYFGGYTAAISNKNYWKIENEYMVSLDVTSMYPSQYVKNMPYGELINIDDKKEYQLIWESKKHDVYRWLLISFDELVWNVDLKKYQELGYDYDYYDFKFNTPLLPDSWNTNNYPCMCLEGTDVNKNCEKRLISKRYFDLISKVCTFKNLKIHAKYLQRTHGFLHDITYKLFEKKNESKGAKRDIAKRVLNSIYGKTAENVHETKKVYDLNNKKWENQFEEATKWNDLISALFITNESRSDLLQAMLAEFQVGNLVLYVDTDSMKIRPKTYNHLKDKNAKNRSDYLDNLATCFVKKHMDPNLGDWVLEYDFYYWYFGGKNKRYLCGEVDTDPGISTSKNNYLKWKYASSGVSENIMQLLTDFELKAFFDYTQNVCIAKSSVTCNFNKIGQPILTNIDYNSNDDLTVLNNVYIAEKVWKNRLKLRSKNKENQN